MFKHAVRHVDVKYVALNLFFYVPPTLTSDRLRRPKPRHRPYSTPVFSTAIVLHDRNNHLCYLQSSLSLPRLLLSPAYLPLLRTFLCYPRFSLPTSPLPISLNLTTSSETPANPSSYPFPLLLPILNIGYFSGLIPRISVLHCSVFSSCCSSQLLLLPRVVLRISSTPELAPLSTLVLWFWHESAKRLVIELWSVTIVLVQDRATEVAADLRGQSPTTVIGRTSAADSAPNIFCTARTELIILDLHLYNPQQNIREHLDPQ